MTVFCKTHCWGISIEEYKYKRRTRPQAQTMLTPVADNVWTNGQKAPEMGPVQYEEIFRTCLIQRGANSASFYQGAVVKVRVIIQAPGHVGWGGVGPFSGGRGLGWGRVGVRAARGWGGVGWGPWVGAVGWDPWVWWGAAFLFGPPFPPRES